MGNVRPFAYASQASRAAIAIALAAAATQAHAQAFEGVPTVVRGGSGVTITDPDLTHTTVTLDSTVTTATINWRPTDHNFGGGAVQFMQSGREITFTGQGSGPQTVLNRVLPDDTSRPIQLDGAITSNANTSVWIYSPGGILVGSTARFNVGSMVLTAADPKLDPDGDYMPVQGRFTLGDANTITNSTAPITIAPDAQINAISAGQSNYVLIFAPQIGHEGIINVSGSAALVAGETANFAIDSSGLFTINMQVGTSVTGRALTTNGTIGGDAVQGAKRRIYLMATPKNDAITSLVSAGGSLGFTVAQQAQVDADDNAIVLSTGQTIEDSGTGSPLSGPPMLGNVAITSGAFISPVYTESAMTLSGDATITSDLDIRGTNLSLDTGRHALTVSGNLDIHADGESGKAPGTVSVVSSGQLNVSGNLRLSALDNYNGQGGNATLTADNGSIHVTGNTIVNTDGGYQSPGTLNHIDARGGNSTVIAQNGGTMTLGYLSVNAAAYGAMNDDPQQTNAVGGVASIVSTGAGSQIVANQVELRADATGGDGSGGSGAGGTARLNADGGLFKTTNIGGGVSVSANGTGGGSNGTAGQGTGGTALITTTGAGQILFRDGASGFSGSVQASAQGVGGNSTGGKGGNAFGGTASIVTTAPGQVINATQVASIAVLANAQGGQSADAPGGSNATGGTAQIMVGGGNVTLDGSTITVDASGIGGAVQVSSGSGTGGKALVSVIAGGSLTATGTTSTFITAIGQAGSGGQPVQRGGMVAIDNAGTLRLATGGGSLTLDASSSDGATLVTSTPTAITRFGSGADGVAGDIVTYGGIAIGGAQYLQLSAGHDLAINGAITASDGGTTIDLIADNTGTGAGTVQLPGTVNQSNGGVLNIYHNPGTLGAPTDYSAAAVGGTLTTYQLVNTVTQLQLAGNFLDQNFALGRTIDASATQGWNSGAGFAPIGNVNAPFTGRFDGLGHQIDGLWINRPLESNIALFGVIGRNATIGNVGLVNATVIGGQTVGGLVGLYSNLDYLVGQGIVSNSYVTASRISGFSSVGGLAGWLNPYSGGSVTIQDSHADVDVTYGGGGGVGGLVGYGVQTNISRSWSTGALHNTGDMGSGVGGLVGRIDNGSITDAYSTVAVNGGANMGQVGGLVGNSSLSQMTRVYATGSVTTGNGSSNVGGLVGSSDTLSGITEGWASGAVASTGAASVGGLIGGNQGLVQNSYWDITTTGQTTAIGTNSGNVGSLTAVSATATGAGDAYASDSYNLSDNWTFLQVGSRPIGAWEYPVYTRGSYAISSAHQVQLIVGDPAGNYRLTQNIDMSGTNGLNDIWNSRGFLPLGVSDNGGVFTGTLSGQGHVLANLRINDTDLGFGGALIGGNYGTIRDIGLVNVNISTQQAPFAGALVGANIGTISGSYATGSVSGGIFTGGLVGQNSAGATVTQSYAAVTVNGTSVAGGLVGTNAGMVSFSYASGLVTAPIAGGLIGETTSNSSTQASYFSLASGGPSIGCGQTPGDNSCSGVSGLTAIQMSQSQSYQGWALATNGGQGLTWRIYEGQTAPLLTSFLRVATAQVGSATIGYDGAFHALPVSIPYADPAHIFGTPTLSDTPRNAGDHALTYVGGYYSDQSGYDIIATPTAGTLTITPVMLTLAAVTDSKTYDGSTAASSPQVQVQVTGLAGSDNISNLAQAFDSRNAGSRTIAVVTGPDGYVINDGNGGQNYIVSRATATGTISQANLTLAAVTDSKTYNATTAASSPQVQVAVTGLASGDSISNLAQAFDSRNAGSRTIAVVTGENGYVINDGNGGQNYIVNTTAATGTIGQATLTLAAASETKTYDATNASAGPVQIIGLQGINDHVDGLVQTFDSANAGNRTLTVSNGYTVVDGNGGANYIVNTANAAGVIAKAALTLTASGDSKVYDTTTASTGTVQYAGLRGSDTVSGLSQTFDSANAGTRSLVVGGGYTISDGNNGGNYAVALVNGAGTITPASLTVTYTANSGSSIYGNVPTGLSGSVSAVGLRGGDTLASQTSGTAAFTTSATGASSVGRYAINGSGLSGPTGNYQISFVQAAGNATALSITARAITATANAITRGEGAANPALTYALAGPTPGAVALVNGDQLTGTLATTATTASPIGSYAITQGTLAANSNYSLTYVGNTLTIASASSPQQIVQLIPQAAQTIAAVAPNVTAQADATPQVTPTADQQKEEEKAVAQAAKPAAVRTVLINDGTAAIPVPVDEDVTSNGASGLWTPR